MSSQENATGRSHDRSPQQQEQGSEMLLTPATPMPVDAVPTIEAIQDTADEEKRGWLYQLKGFWSLLSNSKLAMVGLCVVGFFILLAIFGPFFITANPSAFSPDQLQPPSAAHWLGTTKTGQDLLAQIVYGARASLIVGFSTALVSSLIAIVIGISSGYFGGIWDEIASLFTNLFLVIPSFVLIVLIASYLPIKGLFPIAMAIAVTSWAGPARGLRAQTLSMRGREFIEASRASGESAFRLIFFEILPNELPIIVPAFIGSATGAILAEAGLEFLGLGDPSVVSWGSILYWAQVSNAFLVGAWWWIVAPGFCLALLGAGFACINFGMDIVSNPRLQIIRLPKIKKSKAVETEKEMSVA